MLSRLAGAVWAPVPWMLEATVVLEAVLGKWLDAGIVAAVLVLNAALGFVQQGRTQATLALLRQRLAVNARVLRDGTWRLLPAAELVPEDVVHVRVGDFVPADLALAEGTVMVDQSTLTGESIPADHGSGEAVFSGSVVVRGEATGTITANRLVVAEVVAQPPASEADVLRWAAAASEQATQDPIDLAILHAASDVTDTAPRYRRVGFVPFDPATKRSEADLDTDTGSVRVAKGAPQVIAELTGEPPDPGVARLAARGARVLAVALRHDGRPWRTLGLISLADPPRPEAAALVGRLSELGVRVVMVTGDTAATATTIAHDVGITGQTMRAPAIRREDGDHATEDVGFGVVAEVLPEDKHRLVARLQAAGHVVGMTGDGVNDAPALRQADVGIAVAGATDVAKSAAGVVLTREGLADIVDLVTESRRIHQRSLTYALNVSIKKLEVPILLAVGVFAWRQFVFTPLLMALLLLGNDVISMAIVTDRTDYARRPDRWEVRRIIAGALVVALPLVAISIAVLWIGRDIWPRYNLDHLRTLIFLTLVLSNQAGLYLVRTRNHAWTARPSRALLIATGADIAAVLTLVVSGTLMAALPVTVIAAVLGAVLLGALAADLVKVPAFRALGLHRLWRRQPGRT